MNTSNSEEDTKMSDSSKYEGLTPEDVVEGLRVLIASESPALRVRPIGNMGGGTGGSPGGSTGTKNYPDLLNKPRINGVELVGNKTSEELGLTSQSVDIPEKLPNPHALTIQYDNVKTVYDGSSAKSVTIPKVEPAVEIDPLTIIDGEDRIVYDGKSPKSVTLPQIPEIPKIPDTLPNPNPLTISMDGVDTSYDGSQSKTVVIPDKLANPGKLIISQSEKQDIEYDGSEDTTVHLPSASVIAEKDVLFSDVNFHAVGETVTLANSYKDYEYLVFTFHGKRLDMSSHGAPTVKWVKVSDIVNYNTANDSDCIFLDNQSNQSIMLGFVDDVTIKLVRDNSIAGTTVCDINCIGMNFVQPPMNPFPLIITQGDQVHEYTGHETVNVTVPDTSKGIKNPNALTIKEAGKADILYDGSVGKEITIPTIPDFPDIPDVPDKLPNPHALTVNFPDGSTKVYDGSAAKSIDIPAPSVDNKPLTLRFEDQEVTYDGKAAKEFNVEIPASNIVIKKEDVLIDTHIFKEGELVPFSKPISNYDYIIIKWMMHGLANPVFGFPDFQLLKVSDLPISATQILPEQDVLDKLLNHVHQMALIPRGATNISHQECQFTFVGTSLQDCKLNTILRRQLGYGDFNWQAPTFKVYGYKFAKETGESQEGTFGKKLIIIDGDNRYEYNGSKDEEITIHSAPEKLPNPEKLTVRSNAGNIVEYDGSAAQNILVDKMDALVNVDVLADNFPAWKDGQVFDLASDISEFDYILIDYALCRSGNISAYNYSETKWVKTDDLLTSPDKDVLLSNIRQNDAIFIGASIVTFPDNNTFKTATLRSSTHGDYIIQVLRVSGVKFDRASDKIGGAPVGEIIAYMGNTPPENYLVCDGSEYNIADYYDLATHFQAEFGSANHFGGDGTTTFAVPDLRGEFLRGTGEATRSTGSGADVAGVHQDGTNHPFVFGHATASDKWITTGEAIDIGFGGNRLLLADKTYGSSPIYIIGQQTGYKSPNRSNINSYTSRPTNTSVMYCIKAKVTYNLDNGEAASNVPNEELTIQIGDDIPKVYDGTIAVSVQIPDKNPTPNALKLYDDKGNETVFDGSAEKSVHLSRSDVLAQRVVLADNIPKLAAKDVVSLSQDITEFDAICLNYGLDSESNTADTKMIQIRDNYLKENNQSDEILLMRMYGVDDVYTAISVFKFIDKNKLQLDRINRTITDSATPNNIKLTSVTGIKYINAGEKLGESPVGHIISFMGTDAPKNYLACDGQEYNIVDYPELAGHFTTAFGSSNYFGGDGVSTFAVPDLRGEFLRGTGEAARQTGSGVDVGNHQDASEILTFFTGNEIGCRRNVIPDTSRFDKYEVSPNVCITGTARIEGDNYPCGLATTRPTNTSVMYCIKCRSTYSMNYKIDNYSTEEHVCGVWVDGKTLYERTIVVDMNRPGLAATTSSLLVDLPDEYDFIFVDSGQMAFRSSSTIYTYKLNTYMNGIESVSVYSSNNSLRYIENIGSSYTVLKYYIKIRYTKK